MAHQGGQGSKVVDLVDSQGTPLAVPLTAANHADVKLIEPTLDNLTFTDQVPEPRIDDKAAETERGIELVCPHRQNRKRPPTQDSRPLRRYRRRWKIERTHSWFHNFRRTIIRYETTLARDTGWIQLTCVILTLRRF
jgi:transposase